MEKTHFQYFRLSWLALLEPGLSYWFFLRSVLSFKIITTLSNFAYITHWWNWLADVPETGYVLLYSAYENGWAPGNPTKITYSEQNGLTIDNGLRTVLSNLDISPFAIKSYSVHGMKGSTDPPAVTDGVFTVKITSADYGENPLSIFPFVVTGIIGAGVIILIFSKKRS